MKKENSYFDKPRNLKKVRIILYCLCVFLILLDLFVPKHGHFEWEGWIGFFCIYGSLSYVFLVVVATYCLRPVVRRDEKHYDK